MNQREWKALKPQIVATLRDLSIAPSVPCFGALQDSQAPQPVRHWADYELGPLRTWPPAVEALVGIRDAMMFDTPMLDNVEIRLCIAAAIEGGALDAFYEPEVKPPNLADVARLYLTYVNVELPEHTPADVVDALEDFAYDFEWALGQSSAQPAPRRMNCTTHWNERNNPNPSQCPRPSP